VDIENLVILEVLKGRINQGLPPHLYFWRDRTGHEIDLIGEWGGRIHAIEIKYGATFQESYVKDLKFFMELCKQNPHMPLSNYLIYRGNQEGKFLDVTLTPIQQIHKNLLES